jgi:hypothetical protein
VRVEIDDVGVRVRSPISFPRVWIPFDRITAVQAVDVRPMKVGGWGYRGSMRLFRRAAWVVRAGPGLRGHRRRRGGGGPADLRSTRRRARVTAPRGSGEDRTCRT